MRGPPPASPLRDAWVALPAALVLLLMLSTFTLLTYRNAVRRLVAERQQEALVAAGAVAPRAAAGVLPATGELRGVHPAALRLVVADATGQVLATIGEPLATRFAAPLGGALPAGGATAGPDATVPDGVVAFVPFARGGHRQWLRLDLAEPALASQQRTQSVLTWTGFGLSAAVLIWVLLFLRQLLRPYETLLRRARELGAPDDESAFLLATVERALGGREEGGELEVLQRTLGPSLASGLLLLDRAGRVLALNPAGAGLLGPAPPPRTPLAELLAEQPALRTLLGEAVRSGQGVQRQESEVIVAGAAHRLGFSATPLRRPDGDLLGFLVLFSDLTASDREQHQTRLAESLAHLGELAAGVAHELRNGLATLAGYLGLLERDPGRIAEYMLEMRGETQHLQRVVADFLSFARPETARLEPVDLQRLVRHAVADPAHPPGAFVVALAEEPPAVLPGDPQLLERALRNLLRNAMDAQQRQGVDSPIEVAARWRDDGFEITILDRGPGLTPEVRRRLFQPFASDRPGGVGLGLALAHRIVALHGGMLSLEDAPGGGARARLSFPHERFAPAEPAQRR